MKNHDNATTVRGKKVNYYFGRVTVYVPVIERPFDHDDSSSSVSDHTTVNELICSSVTDANSIHLNE